MTIKMLAKELSLSVATVSKALSDSHEVSLKTKLLVREAAGRLGYVANPYASSLRRRRSKTIAVVLPEIVDSFFSEAINGIETVAQLYGYHVLIYLSHESFSRERAILDEFKSGRVDGILISVSEETENSEHIKKVIDAGIPVVFFDRVCEDVNTSCVVSDDYESSLRATTHLIEMGCRKPSFLTASLHLSINTYRMKGFRDALCCFNIAETAEQVLVCERNEQENYWLLRQLLNRKDRPDGFVVSIEKLTSLVYAVCRDIGLSIPNDIKVLTFANLKIAPFMSPPLTTVCQPAFDIGKAAATILFKALGRSNFVIEKETVVLDSEMIKRESSTSVIVPSM